MNVLGTILLVIVVVFACAAHAQAPLHGMGQENTIPDEFIVVLERDTTIELRATHMKRLATKSVGGVKILSTFNIGTFIGYSAILNKDALETVRFDPVVRYVAANQVVSVHTHPSAQNVAITQPVNSSLWGLDRIDQRNLPLNNQYNYLSIAGNGVTVYVVDTGIRISHNEFGTRARWGANFVDSNNNDCDGHGTHVAGTIGGTTFGVAKLANLVAVKVLDCSGSGSWTGIINGINWVVNDYYTHPNISIINMSLGGAATQAVDDAVAAAVAAGIHVVVAAGNSNANACNYSPARAPDAITVGCTRINDTRSSFSNYGTCLSLFAPGEDILSSWYTSNTATAVLSGTSMSSPHVAGIAAIQLADFWYYDQWLSPSQLHQLLLEDATPGKVANRGPNSPNLLAYSYH